ncbi:hypothetical protein EJ04DRAFT_454336 [Polyplosphaeria fusca]|uniref:DUF1996 domain-containing protein n=1 Tax=Polyplosphaeria fusca TaxID=682080 RepID=A0A9P4RCV1_9PLEO|nr:hypothetical protein EJ04DRAFT_454336 [Polyplosphaeria fusca]
MYTSLAALTATLAATATAFDCHGPYFSFYNRAGNALSYQRLDPALYPGVESPHLHSFDGGNALAADMSFDTTQGSECTTARIKPDKSLYWRPTLFWNGNNTGFYRVPDKFLKTYYKFGDPGNVKASVSEFPEGFNMIAGNPFLRSDDGSNAKGPGIKWSCKGENYAATDAIGFPKGFTSCKEGLATEITFPACWNGNMLDPKKPSAHMAYPNGNGKGLDACPDGFKKARFPTIFIEFWYDVSAFDGQYSADDTPWVLSNGDPTGYGFHADFLNGWEKGVLAKATADEGYCNCGCGCGTDQMKECFGAENVNDDGDAGFKSCAASPLFGGDDKSPLDKLPGCNPLQSGPALATPVTGAGCAATGGAGAPKTSAAAGNTGAPSSASSATSIAKTTAAPAASSAESEDASTDAASLSFSMPNKQEGSVSGGYDFATTSAAAAASSSSLVFDDTATKTDIVLPSGGGSYELPSSAATTASPAESGSPGGPGGDECKTPVYVTITPTITVTAGAVGNTTACDFGTITKTVTNTATVTVSEGGYKHKRHANPHKY